MEEIKRCSMCGKDFAFKKYAGTTRKYCSLNCARLAGELNRNNPEKRSNYSHKGYLSHTIISRYNGRCAICGWRATEELITHRGRVQHAYGNEIHHIVPVEDGGEASETNLILLCPNHHKQADIGIITQEELKGYIIKPSTDEEKQAMKNKSVDRIAKAIF